MVSLKPLEAVGYSQAFFKLPTDAHQAFTWYTFDTVYPPGRALRWNLLGLRHRMEKTMLFDMQCFFVDDDELSMKEFDPIRYANHFLWIDPDELLALITFFEDIVGSEIKEQKTPWQHFQLLTPQELSSFHAKNWEIDMYANHCYRYVSGTEEHEPEIITLFCLPQWVQKQKLTHTTTLEIMMFERQQLATTEFSPFDTYGLVTITFNQRALEEFIILLKQRAFEAAQSTFQRVNK